jgi:hypothetical protein
MVEPWPDIAARYFRKFAPSEPFQAAYDSVGALSAEIERTWLRDQIFGWTSMHDLCVQQTDHQPYTRPHLRISPRRSGEVHFRFIDTPIVARQWHRVVVPDAVASRFARFLDDLKWVEGVEYVDGPTQRIQRQSP